MVNVEFPVVKIAMSKTDMVFLLEDNSYLHLAFQSTSDPDDFPRHIQYDVHLHLRERRFVRTVIIYIADVKKRPEPLIVGSLEYRPDVIMMADYDGDSVFAELNAKIKSGDEFTDVDMLNLIFLPLMRISVPRYELAVESVKMAETIPDETKRNTCLAAAFAFASKYLDENQTNKLMGVFKKMELVDMLIEETRGERDVAIAKNFLRDGYSIKSISRNTGLDESTVKALKAELNQKDEVSNLRPN